MAMQTAQMIPNRHHALACSLLRPSFSSVHVGQSRCKVTHVTTHATVNHAKQLFLEAVSAVSPLPPTRVIMQPCNHVIIDVWALPFGGR